MNIYKWTICERMWIDKMDIGYISYWINLCQYTICEIISILIILDNIQYKYQWINISEYPMDIHWYFFSCTACAIVQSRSFKGFDCSVHGRNAGGQVYTYLIYERRRASTSHISFHLMDLTLISTQGAAGFDPKLYDLIFPSLWSLMALGDRFEFQLKVSSAQLRPSFNFNRTPHFYYSMQNDLAA